MKRCLVCNRPLRTLTAIAAGIGPKCKKKIDPEAAQEIQEIVKQGFDASIQNGRIIQLQIRVGEDPPGK